MKSFAPLLLMLALSAAGQNGDDNAFYRHYSGTLDTNMRMTMDILSQNGKISGYYFYSFELAEQSGEYHYGKTIPLTGTLDGNRLVMYEFSNTDSKFSGNVKEDRSIRGTWQRRKYEDPIPFSLKEDYKVGSIPMHCFSKSYENRLDLPEVPYEQRPAARIEILLMYPEHPGSESLKTELDHTITSFMLNDSINIKDPGLLIENITFDFFQSYQEATDGVPNIEQTSSFNWLKKMTMEVLYNENNLLSLRLDKHGYTGGAHGVDIVRHRVFNLLTNRPLELHDIFVPGYEEELVLILDKKLRRLNGIGADENLRESGFLIDALAHTDNFYVNNDGIGFFYNVYEIAAYATGSTALFCSFYDLKGILRQDHPFFWISN